MIAASVDFYISVSGNARASIKFLKFSSDVRGDAKVRLSILAMPVADPSTNKL